jgi:hypothetical protein
VNMNQEPCSRKLGVYSGPSIDLSNQGATRSCPSYDNTQYITCQEAVCIILSHYSNISLDILRKTIANLIQDSWFSIFRPNN